MYQYNNPDIQDPVRDLPRAIFISCVACLVIYVLTIVAFHTTLSTAEVLGSEAVAVTFANRLYGRMAWVIPIFVSCSTFNSIVDASMVDIVKTAKEARAMIRKLSFTPLEDGDGRVKFELGWDEESDDCVASFIRTSGADVWDSESETPVISFKQSDCDFQYYDFDWDDSIGWIDNEY